MKEWNHRKKTIALSCVTGGVILAIYVLGLAIPEKAIEGSYLEAYKAPSLQHFFGTDSLGRDLFWRSLKGLSVSFTIGVTASVVSAILAAAAGAGAASGSRLADLSISWVIDLVMSVPHMVLVLLISFALGRGIRGLFAGIAATHWCSLARLIRGEVLQLRSKQYVAVSRRLGKSGLWVFFRHFQPHLLPQILIGLVLLFPHVILHEASVSFLGFGLPPEQPSIGIILSESMRSLSMGKWWHAVLPGVMLALVVLLIDRLGESLQLLFDPAHAQE